MQTTKQQNYPKEKKQKQFSRPKGLKSRIFLFKVQLYTTIITFFNNVFAKRVCVSIQ